MAARCGARGGRCYRFNRESHDRCRGGIGVKQVILVAGMAGLAAGSMSMAVGEYVSVSSQRDAKQADIGLEMHELESEPEAELQELAMIYVNRGLERELALKVAKQLSAHDRLGAHMRDELGIDQTSLARPLQAAWISAASFASFAIVPLLALLVAPAALAHPGEWSVLAGESRVALGAIGDPWSRCADRPGNVASHHRRCLAMTVTAVIGRILGITIG